MSLYKRGNIWWVRIMHQGQMVYRSSKSEDRKVALELEKSIKRDIALNRIGREHTLDEVALEWTKLVVHQKDARNSLLNLRHIADYIDGIPIKEAPSAARKIIEAFKGLSPATINRRLALVRRFVSLAHQWGWIDTKPYIGLLDGESSRNVYLTKAQAVQIAKESGKSKWHILFLVATGMRVSEMINCEVKENLIYIRDTKNNKPRAIPLTKAANAFYSRMIPRAYRTIWKDFDNAREALGYTDLRIHDLRHTNASWLVQRGVNLATVRDILGHSSLSVTSRYTHLATSHMRDALEKI